MNMKLFIRLCRDPAVFVTCILVISACAKIGRPTGGPRDEDPPVLTGSNPDNFSTGFDGNRITIDFDEYIVLRDVNRELTISPPLEKNPVVRLRDKGLVLDLPGELKEDMTYTLNFGRAVADNNEQNVLRDFRFVFSTGSHIDTMSIYGKVLDAFSHEPPEDPFLVMLYRETHDSVPLTTEPLYLGKTGEEGRFSIDYIAPGKYKVFALKDVNYNYLYDLREEKIAFLEQDIVLNADSLDREIIENRFAPEPDTGVFAPGEPSPPGDRDTTAQDTTSLYMPVYSAGISLFAFREDNQPQYLKEYVRPDRNRFILYFNRVNEEDIRLKLINRQADSGWYMPDRSIYNDTVEYWITRERILSMDTLILSARYQVTDSLGKYVPFADTLRLLFTETSEKKKKKRDEPSVEEKENLAIRTNIRPGKPFDLNRNVLITTAAPVDSVQPDSIRLFFKQDTSLLTQSARLIRDTTRHRRFSLSVKWKGNAPYRLRFLPGAFRDIYGKINDTLDLDFTTRDPEHYGALSVLISGVDQPVIIQLLSGQDDLVREQNMTGSGRVNFAFLEPGQYKLKCIYDRNGNQQWDTGDYLEGIQPEMVEFKEQEISIRTNWELEVPWVPEGAISRPGISQSTRSR